MAFPFPQQGGERTPAAGCPGREERSVFRAPAGPPRASPHWAAPRSLSAVARILPLGSGFRPECPPWTASGEPGGGVSPALLALQPTTSTRSAHASALRNVDMAVPFRKRGRARLSAAEPPAAGRTSVLAQPGVEAQGLGPVGGGAGRVALLLVG